MDSTISLLFIINHIQLKNLAKKMIFAYTSKTAVHAI